MFEALIFSFLAHVGWLERPAPWVARVQPTKLVQTVVAQSPELSVGGSIQSNKPKGRTGFPGPLWRQAAQKHGLDPLLLYSVALLESGKQTGRRRVGPWPYALHFNEAGVTIQAATLKEAQFILAHVATDNVDIGLGQINYRSHKHRIRRPEDLLDPRVNLTVMSDILAESLRSAPNMELGIGRYHSRTPWRARAYGKKALAVYRALRSVAAPEDASS